MLICVEPVAHAQYIKMEHGVFSTAYKNFSSGYNWEENTHAYTVNMGMDFLERRWFYISSKVGYTQVGGATYEPFNTIRTRREFFNYFHAGSSFRAYRRDSKVAVFLGLGPYVNALLGEGKITKMENYSAKSYMGALAEVGFHFNWHKARFGLSAEYRRSLTETTTNGAENHNFGVLGSVGVSVR